MRVVCISDTHGHEVDVPNGDLLLHAGDLTRVGTLAQIEAAHAWLASLPHRHKVVVAGNHDFDFERDSERAQALMTDVTYLEDAETTVDGLRIWGSPWQPWFRDWAFNLERGAPLRAVWERVPTGVDVLLTHGPPHGVMDRVLRGEAVGCEELAAALERIRPRLHVFGHIHEGYGVAERDGTRFVNASTCTVGYEPTNPPVVVDL